MKQLKFLSYLLVTVLCFGFASCSDDDDDDSIIGTWELTNEKGWSREYDAENEKWGEKEDWSEDYKAGKYHVTYKSDNTGTVLKDGQLDENFTWTLTGRKLLLNRKHVSGEERTDDVVVKKLTSNELMLFFVIHEESLEEEYLASYRRIK